MDLGEKRSDESEGVPPRRTRFRHWFLPRGERHWATRLQWARVAAVGCAVLVTAYLGLTLVAFGFVRYQRKLESVRLVDVVLPWRWDNYRVARGDQHVS